MQFVLASRSPARLRILREAGIDPIVRVSEVDEEAVLEALPHASADEKVRALAAAKGRRVASAISEGRINVPEAGKLPRECVLVACDSMLESGGKLLGKPHDPQTALTRVKELSMSQATLWSGHYLVHLRENTAGWEIIAQSTRSCATQICFGAISEEEAAAYVASGEPLEVAGSFTIDGLGGAFIDEIHGDHYRLTDKQWNEINNNLHMPGIPAYFLLDRKGEIAFENLTVGGYPGNEVVKEVITKALNKK